jgi:hypothetical protein
VTGAIALRLATAADAEPIAELFIVSFRLLTFLPELHTPDEDRVFIRDVVLPTHRVKVAERDGRIVGFMGEKDGGSASSTSLRRRGAPALGGRS